jgi:hypothetical protein
LPPLAAHLQMEIDELFPIAETLQGRPVRRRIGCIR